MRIKIDYILMGVLWLLAAVLGTSFWFNTVYGFNILSIPHWQYLAYLQASRTPVYTSFYISFAIAIFLTIFGMYVLLRPQFRHLRLPVFQFKKRVRPPKQPKQKPESRPAPPAPTPQPTESVQPAPTATVNAPAETQPTQPTEPAAPRAPMPPRPPRLNIATIHNAKPVYPAATATKTTAPATEPAPAPAVAPQDDPQIHEIFEQAGYTVKPSPKIAGQQTALLAIGENEQLWVGAIGIDTPKMQEMIDKLQQVFTDTLDDIFINVTGFIISAPDADTNAESDILHFNSVDDLRAYMAQHPNPTSDSDDPENFAAYSEYIDTVINYIGKI